MNWTKPVVSVKKLCNYKCRFLLCAAILFCFSFASAQPYIGATWSGYNSNTQAFPFNGLSRSSYFLSATHNNHGLAPWNDARCAWGNNNTSKTINIASAPYLSYTIVTNANITFDRFVLNGLAILSPSKFQLRWSVDNFTASLGEFTPNGSSYTLSSVPLSSAGAIEAGSIEFRIYYYDASGYTPAKIYNVSIGGTVYSSVDGTPTTYAVKNTNASIWYNSANIVLPVTLIDFNVQQNHNKVALMWSTASENNCKHFSVERSNDGISFLEIKSVIANGGLQTKQNYTASDEAPVQGKNFYRLKMIDKDGVYQYSPVKKIEYRANESTGIKIYPVPTFGYVMIENSDPDFVQSLIKITDAAGNTVLKTRAKSHVEKMNLSSFAPGLYFIHLQNSHSYKIVKK